MNKCPHLLKVIIAFIALNCVCDLGWAMVGRYTSFSLLLVFVGIVIFAILQALVAEHQEKWKGGKERK